MEKLKCRNKDAYSSCEYTDKCHPVVCFKALDEFHEMLAEPKRGEWIPCTKSGLPLTELMRREGQKWYGYRCSNCNHIYKGNALTDCNFCPNCGARMKGADDE